ncbi:porin [Caenimonas sp. S4]|nr:porin [Caenimonas soli]
MQKKLLALAAMSACGIASAQSSVTLYGVIDTSYESVKTNAGRISGFGGSGYRGSRIGFRGVEDLGGGLKAGFVMEGGFNADNGSGAGSTTANNQNGGLGAGALIFGRRSTVSLSGSFGELRFGRDYNPNQYNWGYFDPIAYGNTVGTAAADWASSAMTQPWTRVSNSIGYFLPGNLGGINGQVMYAFGERASNETFAGTTPAYAVGRSTKKNGTFIGGRIGYTEGPIDTQVTYDRTTYAAGTFNVSPLGIAAIPTGSSTELTWGASYKFGSIKPMVLIARRQNDDAGGLGNTLTMNGWNIGAIWTVGGGEVQMSYGRAKLSSALLATEPEAHKWSIGYLHNLSKRTAVYGYLARVGNSGGAALTAASASPGALGAVGGAANINGTSTGFQIGVSHTF